MSSTHVIGAISPANSYGVPFDRVDHAAQAIAVASGELLDAAREAGTLSEALQLASLMGDLRARIDAVATRALDRADELTGMKGSV